MGRKPNALILQHFERGAKLNDSSNRYAHTCKSCGEKFPKGRIDSLTTHLVKKCPAISLRDRQKALLELNNLPDIGNAGQGQNGQVPLNGPTVELPVGGRHWTALETLAEVSRQIDLNEKHDDRPPNERAAGPASDSGRTRADQLALQEQYTLDNPPVSYEQRVQRDKKMANQQLRRPESELSLSAAALAAHISHSRSVSPSHASLAIAATTAAAQAAARFIPSMVDPQLLDDASLDSHTQMSDKMLEQQLSEANASMPPIPDSFYSPSGEAHQNWPMLDGTPGNMYVDHENTEPPLETAEVSRASTYPRIAMNPTLTTEFSSEYGNGQKQLRPKVRGKFTAKRRQEVQQVRKMGACIRCRMLKKPCSEGTPCATCKSVESARLWKTPCIRTKLADELDLYSGGLHAVLAHHEVSSAKSRTPLIRSSPNQLEASHYPETTVFATFKALEGQQIPGDGNIDPGLGGDLTTHTLRVLDHESDDLPLKLEAYMKRMMSVFFENEPSKFMNVTLSTAQELALDKQDALLTKVLELWAAVHILVDHELHWTISDRVEIDAPAGSGPQIHQDAGDGIYQLLSLQLNAAAEKKAAQLCKSVLLDLEKRLLTRTSNTPFETFLVAVIILNCVEKSTWLFKSWEQESFKSRWPLDKKPVHYASQGEKMTEMLQMLLKMRNVPPKTFSRPEDGVLATDTSAAAKLYFENMQLNYNEVLNKQANHTFDPADSRCYELRFCSRLLLPQN